MAKTRTVHSQRLTSLCALLLTAAALCAPPRLCAQGTITALASPASNTSTSPSPTAYAFTFQDSNTGSWAASASADIVFFNQTWLAGSCYLLWQNGSPATLWLLADNGQQSESLSSSNSYAGAMSNSSCGVASVGVSVVGNTLTVSAIITPLSAFLGTQTLALYASNSGNTTPGWVSASPSNQPYYWSVPDNTLPSAPSIQYSQGNNTNTGTFTILYGDTTSTANGYAALAGLDVSIWNVNWDGACEFEIKPYTGQIYLYSDDDESWSSGSPATISSALYGGTAGAGTVSNSQCTIYGSTVALQPVSQQPAQLQLTLTILFSSSFAGPKNVSLQGIDTGGNGNWSSAGTWTVGSDNQAPTVGLMSPSSGASYGATFTFPSADPNGAANVAQLQGNIMGLTWSNACQFMVDMPGHTLYLANDAGTAWQGSIGIPSSGSVPNSQCTISGTGASILINSSQEVSLTLPITFSASFNGMKQVYTIATDSGGLTSGWQPEGGWTVSSPPPIISNLSLASGPAGALVTITGRYFGQSQGNGAVTFNGVSAGIASNWGETSIKVVVPSGASTGNVVVTVNGQASSGTPFTVTLAPFVSALSPTSGAAGTTVTISGHGFGSAQGTGRVLLGTTYGVVTSWQDDTTIVATVASNSQSGTAQVQQSGVWSNAPAFTVTTATITGLSVPDAAPGTSVTVYGSGFGNTQGSGQVWLGTANGVVSSWIDGAVTATVAAGATSGSAQVLQNGVMSNAWPFTVDTLHIASITPTSGSPGNSVTITGTGFGATQGSGSVVLGSMAGQVTSWNLSSDNQIVATVAVGAVSGVVRVQQNGVWSNAITFTVGSGNTLTLSPNVLTMMAGDTHNIQALNSTTHQPVTGLTWASSDQNVVTLSTADPPVLTALAPGHVTITAGAASADVTVFAVGPGAPPVGTVLWSVPGSVTSIVPAVPSPSGVADVFAFQGYPGYAGGTVQAITSDGATVWTADVSQTTNVVPDFLGGLVGFQQGSIVRLDGMTGQIDFTYTPGGTSHIDDGLALHPDGTIFAIESDPSTGAFVVGIDPTTGAQKFKVPIPQSATARTEVYGVTIAGDGNAYVPYLSVPTFFDVPCMDDGIQQECGWGNGQFALLQISSAGAFTNIPVYESVIGCDDACITLGSLPMIANADQGIVLSWTDDETVPPGDYTACCVPTNHIAITTGTTVVVTSVFDPAGPSITPVLQAQDGSFVGTGSDGTTQSMVSFDSSGNIRWMVPNEQPQIATADGGVIGQSGITYDQNGNATGQIASLPTLSWTGNAYELGSTVHMEVFPILVAEASVWAFSKANPSGNGTAAQLGFTLQGPSSYKTTYNGNALQDCRGRVLAPVWYGYQECETYTVWGKNTPPIQITDSGTSFQEMLDLVDYNVEPITHGGPAETDSRGKLVDSLLLGSSTQAPQPGNFVVEIQTIMLQATGTTVRVNCLDFEATDVTVTDITNAPQTQCTRKQ